MKEKTKEWLKIIGSILIFNALILAVLCFYDLIKFSTICLKVVLDISIGFMLDKSITKINVGFIKGFSMERKE